MLNKPIYISSGEPAGIGPDIILKLLARNISYPFVVGCDAGLLETRASQLGIPLEIILYPQSKAQDINIFNKPLAKNQLVVLDIPARESVEAGILNVSNAQYVLDLLDCGIEGCLAGDFSALVTAPVQKSIINDAGIVFTGHTEYFAERTSTKQEVMMLASESLRVALVTTHAPLKDIPSMITVDRLTQVMRVLHQDLVKKFGIQNPKVYVCGLNPHAGEQGHLGSEELEIINPVINQLRDEGMQFVGSMPADTLFQDKYLSDADAVLTMYHDQGLPVLKSQSFGKVVNITLGLPFIRTSVDHGTALDLAGTGLASDESLYTAMKLTESMLRRTSAN